MSRAPGRLPALVLLATCLATGLATGLGGAVAPPAGAAGGRLTDPVDDVPAYADVRALRAVNGRRLFSATLRLRAARPALTSAYVVLEPVGDDAPTYFVGTQSLPRRHRDVFVAVGDGGIRHLRCRGVRVEVDPVADVVRVRVPQRCLGDDAGRMAVAGLTEGARGDFGDHDSTRALRLARG